MYQTLISAKTLHAHLNDPDWVIVDCRFSLDDVAWGRQAYLESHIPGAVYAHLDEDLSGPPVTDNGRHPLPSPEDLNQLFRRLGINHETQVVAYDNANGVFAARLWWMLRFMGHENAAVLDGGWAAWQEGGYEVSSGEEENELAAFHGKPNLDWLVKMDEVPNAALLIDSRAPDRYAGKFEPLDAKAGHIPGAKNYFYQNNWDQNGRYQPPEMIRKSLHDLLSDAAPEEAVFYCGSGVSACVNLLSMAHAGLGSGRLYVGSWSEWSRSDENPVATG